MTNINPQHRGSTEEKYLIQPGTCRGGVLKDMTDETHALDLKGRVRIIQVIERKR